MLLPILRILIANLPVGAPMGKFPALVGISYLALLLVTTIVTQILIFTPAEAQSVTIETSAGTFFGHAALQVIIEDDSADDVNDSILVDIEGVGALSDSGSFVIEDTTDGSQRFEFFLVHEDADLAAGAGVDGLHNPPIIIRFGGSDSHLFTGGPLFDEVTFEITRTGEVVSVDYEQVAAKLSLDRPTPYGSTSIVRISIEDQDANLNPTDSDSFDIDVDDMNGELFDVNGGDFTADPITFVETGENSSIFEAEVSLNTDFDAHDEIVDLTLNDQANYDTDLTRSDGTTIDINAPDINGSVDTDVVSFEIDDVDGELDGAVGIDLPISGGALTFSTEFTMDLDIRDSDQNLDSANEDDLGNALIVRIDSSGGDFESVPLTETGDNTGTFEIDLSNGKMEITFLADDEVPVINNNILEFRSDDVEQDILVYYLDPLDDDSNTEITISYVANLDLMPGQISVPGIVGPNDNFTITLTDGDLNDRAAVIESYTITLDGTGPYSFETDTGDIIGDLASFEFSINQVPAEFDFPVIIELLETGPNTGVFQAGVYMADIISSVNMAGQIGRIDITYGDEMPPSTSVGTIIMPPAIAVGSVECITPTGSTCVDTARPRWGLDRLKAILTVYPAQGGGHTLQVNFGEGVIESVNFDGNPNNPFDTTVTMSAPYPEAFTGPSETISLTLNRGNRGGAGIVTQTTYGDFLIQGHRTELSLDPIADVASGESVTISGRLLDLDTNTGIDGKTIQFSGDGVESFATSQAITDSNGDFTIQGDSGQAGEGLIVIASFAGDSLYQSSQATLPINGTPEIIIENVNPSRIEAGQGILVTGRVDGGSVDGMRVVLNWGDDQQSPPIPVYENRWEAWHQYNDEGDRQIIASLIDVQGLEVDNVQGSIAVVGSFPVIPVVVGSGVAAGITLVVLKTTNIGPFKKYILPPPRLVPIGKIEPVHLTKPDREFADLSAADSELEQISKKMQSLSFEDVKSTIIEDFQNEEVMRRGLTQLVSIVKNKKIDETEVVSTVSSEAAIRMSESTIGDYFRSDFLKGLGFAAEIKRGQALPEGKKLRVQFKGFMIDFIPYFDTLMMEGYVGAALRYLEPNLDVPIFKLLLRINSEIQIRNIESGVSAGRNIVTLKDVTFVLKPNIMGVEIGPGHRGAGLQNVLQGFTVPVPSREINLPLKKLKIDRITLWVSNPKGYEISRD